MASQITSKRTFIESALLLLILLAIIYAVFSVLSPFFGIFTFALIFAVSFSSPYERFAKLLNGRRKLAAFIYVVVVLSIVTVPFIYIVSAISEHIREALQIVNDTKENGLPPLPIWIKNLPMIGSDIDAFWQNILSNPEQTIEPYKKQIKNVLNHLVSTGTGMLGATLQFVLGIIISGFLLVSGRKILLPVKSAMKHLLGARDGIELLSASGQAIKGVSIGVIGTALIASILCFIGLTIAGVPFAVGFAALVFFLVLIQIGPLPIMIPLIIWYSTLGSTGWTIFLIAYTVGVLIIEAILRPILISKSGGKLPFLVLFLGVTGGLLAWGFTGMFKGAIILAVFYTIFTKWLQKRKLEQDNLDESSV